MGHERCSLPAFAQLVSLGGRLATSSNQIKRRFAMSINEATSLPLPNKVPSLTITLPGWLWNLIRWARDSRQTAQDERIAEELPAHLRYDIGALDHIPRNVSRWQVTGSYQEELERQWRRGV
jgi:hypothetical protein